MTTKRPGGDKNGYTQLNALGKQKNSVRRPACQISDFLAAVKTRRYAAQPGLKTRAD